ncbi:asparagine synthase (glutamine-hydrolyzing) [Halomonas sp. NO4]|uniref:asparagine synthase (glutamine-hydrolyzing) n=1 Tax=Halomonas sp. NO4 TaxID=2484813 RepID=UPI0013D2A4A4|nr:asparagine synthase (glutamine-hydrolyzing) [Halomonas sp. NO4]
MCGLFGFFSRNENISSEQVKAARESCSLLSHRGPDQYGEWLTNNGYIGHQRLSILDLSDAGRQPMVSKCGKVIATVNGEIYNFKSLRKELGEHKFCSNSDSEVVVHGYIKWGIEGLLSRLSGMFAFSVIDFSKNTLLLARDQIGIKPLYYCCDGGLMVWSSELQPIKSFYEKLNLPLVNDKTALYDFLTYKYIPSPKTLYANCFKLEPAHYLSYSLKDGGVSKYKYWALEVSNNGPDNIEDASQILRGLIDESVQEQMVSDVPLGFFLSGGVDSSAVVASATSFNSHCETFSIGFDAPSHDETYFSSIVAKHCKTRHHVKKISAEHLSEVNDFLHNLYGEPFADTSAIPTYHVAKFAKEKVKTVLTGDGGDELFGGYAWYERFEKFHRAQGVARLFRKKDIRCFLSKGKVGYLRKIMSRLDLYCMLDPISLYVSLLNGYTKHEKIELRKFLEIPDDYDDYWFFRQYWRTDLGVKKNLQFLDFHTYLPEDILTKVDRATMKNSLEARVPLLTPKIANFAFSLPESVIYDGAKLKACLKRAYSCSLPNEIVNRKKKGFSIPLYAWGEAEADGVKGVNKKILNGYMSQG